MDDKKLEKYISRLVNLLNKNKYLIKYIERLLWRFSTTENDISENVLIAENHCNEKIRIEIQDNQVLVNIKSKQKNYEWKITPDFLTITRDYIERKSPEEKMIVCNEANFNIDGTLQYTDFWEVKTGKNPKEHVMIYDCEKGQFYGYLRMNHKIRQIRMNHKIRQESKRIYTITNFQSLIEEEKISDDNCIEVLDTLFERSNKDDYRLDSIEKKSVSYCEEILEKVKTFKKG